MKKICSMFLAFFLVACTYTPSSVSPKPPKDPSIIGVYVLSHMFYREGFPSFWADIEDEELREHLEKKSLSEKPRLWGISSTAFRFNENGTFAFYYPHSGEMLEAGVYTYDGKELKLYKSGEKYKFQNQVAEFRLDGWMLIIDFVEDTVGLSATFLYDQSYSETSSSETQ